MISMLKDVKVIKEIRCYKCVYFGTISCINGYTNSRKIQKFLLFSEHYSVFSFISLQIRRHNEMIVMLQVDKHREQTISNNCVYFGAISYINAYTNLRRNSKVFVVFRAVFCFFVNFTAHTTS